MKTTLCRSDPANFGNSTCQQSRNFVDLSTMNQCKSAMQLAEINVANNEPNFQPHYCYTGPQVDKQSYYQFALAAGSTWNSLLRMKDALKPVDFQNNIDLANYASRLWRRELPPQHTHSMLPEKSSHRPVLGRKSLPLKIIYKYPDPTVRLSNTELASFEHLKKGFSSLSLKEKLMIDSSTSSIRPTLSDSALNEKFRQIQAPNKGHLTNPSKSRNRKMFGACITDENYEQHQPFDAHQMQVDPEMKIRYKTILCRHYLRNGFCKYGDKCSFAHGFHELRHIMLHAKFRTKLCKYIYMAVPCPFGAKCTFLHTMPYWFRRLCPHNF